MQLHRVQATFLDCPARLRGFVGGRGAGKSKIGAYDLLIKAKPGRTYMMVAPTYPMLRDASLKTFAELARHFGFIRYFAKADLSFTLGNGARVLCRSADNPDRLRGPNLSGVWMDEAGEIVREAFDIAIACLREAGEQGWLSATFTPKGRSHWTYRVFGEGTDGAMLFRASTADNPFLPPEFYDRVASQYSPLRQRQELEGEFVTLEGAEWPADWFGDAIWFDEWPPHDRGQKVVALDSSKGKGGKSGDYSAFVKAQWCDGVLYVDADLANDRNSSVIADTAVEIQAAWKPHFFGVEEEFGGEVLGADIVRRAAERKITLPLVAVTTEGVNKEVRIRRLTPYLSRSMIRFKANSPGAALLVDQLAEFPQGAHDDGPDALEMAIRVLSECGV